MCGGPDATSCPALGWRSAGIRAMPSARALFVASLLTEPPYGCLGPSGNDRYRKHSQTVGGFAGQLPSCGGSFAMNRPPADVFGQALLEDPPQWAELHVVANRRECRESLGLDVGPWEPATEEGEGRGGRGQDKDRKVRSVGWDGKHQQTPTTWPTLRNIPRNFHVSATPYCCSALHTL